MHTIIRMYFVSISLLLFSKYTISQDSLNTKLLQAVISNNKIEASLLIKKGANVNYTDSNGASILMWAAYKSDLDFFKFLHKSGADTKSKGVIYIDTLKSYYGSLMCIAAGEGNPDLLEYLISECKLDVNEREWNPDTVKKDGWTPLIWSANNGNFSCVEKLVYANSHTNLQSANGRTALHYSLIKKHDSISTFLIYTSSEIDISDTMGWTPLHLASRNNKVDIVIPLLNKGSKINKQTKKGWTPLMLAAYNNNLETCKILFASGAETGLLNNENKSASSLALENDNEEILKLLQSTRDIHKSLSIETNKLNESSNKIMINDNHSSLISQAFFTKNSKYFITESAEDGLIKIWDVKSGKLLKNISSVPAVQKKEMQIRGEEKMRAFIIGLFKKISEDNSLLALNRISNSFFQNQMLTETKSGRLVICTNQNLNILDSAGKLLFTFEKHNSRINSYDINKDHAATASGDGTINLWDIKTGTHLNTLSMEGTNFSTIKFSPSGNFLLASDYSENYELNEFTIYLYNLKNGQLLIKRSFKGTRIFPDVFFDNDEKTVAVKIFNTKDSKISVLILTVPFLSIIKNINPAVSSPMNLLSNGNILTISRDSVLLILDSKNGNLLKRNEFKFLISNMVFDKKPYLILTDQNGNFYKYNTDKNLIELQTKSSKKIKILHLAISPDSKLIAGITSENQIHFYKKIDYSFLSEIENHSFSVENFFIGDSVIMIKDTSNQVRLWDINNLLLKKIDGIISKGKYKLYKVNIDTLYYFFEEDGGLELLKKSNQNILYQNIKDINKINKHEADSIELIGYNEHITTALLFCRSDSMLFIRSLEKNGVINPIGKWSDNSMLLFTFSANDSIITIASLYNSPSTYDLKRSVSEKLFGLNYVEKILEITAQGINEDKFAILCDKQKPKIIHKSDITRYTKQLKKEEKKFSIGILNKTENEVIAEDELGSYNIYDAKTGKLISKQQLLIYKSIKCSRTNSVIAFLANIYNFDDEEPSGTLIKAINFDKKKEVFSLELTGIDYDFELSPDGKRILVSSNHSGIIYEYTIGNILQVDIFAGSKSINAFAKYWQNSEKKLYLSGDNILTLKYLKENVTFSFLPSKTDNYCIVCSNGYFKSSRRFGINSYFVDSSLNIITFDQLDIKYNRPDKVLEAIGSTDTALINSYRQAYYKRIKKLGIDTTSFKEGFTIPEADFKNRDAVDFEQKTKQLKLQIAGKSTENLDRFNVWVNEVPLYGRRGISLRSRNKKIVDTTVTITLSEGDNQVETSVTDVNGTESYRQPLFIKYIPEKAATAKTYFIGIGINRFADSSHNLSWSVKDIRDLSKRFAANGAVIDTLFDEKVTKERILALKKKLESTSEEDKVVIAYSGHGLLSKEYDYFLSTYNVSFSQPEDNGLPYDELESLLDGIKARKKLMLIDACHSGEVDKEEMQQYKTVEDTLKNNNVKKGIILENKDQSKLGMKNSFELMQELFVNVGRSTGATIISAAAGTQFALERSDLQNGVFTFALLDVMNKHKSIKVSDLKNAVTEKVPQLTGGLQKPTFRNENQQFDWSLW